MSLLYRAERQRCSGSSINIERSLGEGHINLLSTKQAQSNHDTIKQMMTAQRNNDYVKYTQLQQSLFFG